MELDERVLKINGGALHIYSQQYDGYTDVFVDFDPDDKTIPGIQLVTITHSDGDWARTDEEAEEESDHIKLLVYDGDGDNYIEERTWSMNELIERQKEN